jgi:hypothetical protein
LARIAGVGRDSGRRRRGGRIVLHGWRFGRTGGNCRSDRLQILYYQFEVLEPSARDGDARRLWNVSDLAALVVQHAADLGDGFGRI